MQLTTVTQKGQVTIPLAIRKYLGVGYGDKVQFYTEKNEVKVKPALDFFSFRGSLKGKKLPSKKMMERIAQDLAVKRYLRSIK